MLTIHNRILIISGSYLRSGRVKGAEFKAAGLQIEWLGYKYSGEGYFGALGLEMGVPGFPESLGRKGVKTIGDGKNVS